MPLRLRASLIGLALLMPVAVSAQQVGAQQSPAAPPAAAPAAATPSPPAATPPSPPAAKPPSPPPAKPPAPQKYRTADGDLEISKVLGSSISNDQNQVIGTISDVLLDKQNKADRVVLSVGGFLGVGSRQVQVPFDHLKIGADKIILPGATKVSLENLSAYQAQ